MPLRKRLRTVLSHVGCSSNSSSSGGAVSHVEGHTYLGEKFITIRPPSAQGRGDDTTLPAPTGAGPTVSVLGLNHLSVETADVERLASFYTDLLGFEPLPRPPFPFGGAWLGLRVGGGSAPPELTLHIIERDPEFEERQRELAALRDKQRCDSRFIRRGHHIALSMRSAAEAEAVLLSHGIPCTRFVVPGGSETTQLFFFDPDGNGVELTGPAAGGGGEAEHPPPTAAAARSRAKPRLGIIGGSGPDAGADLFAKVLGCHRERLGASYAGDEDAPDIVLLQASGIGGGRGVSRPFPSWNRFPID
jgi:catechol 2,3-dioxygenase-like lactoylglutathione lyase family enzyme